MARSLSYAVAIAAIAVITLVAVFVSQNGSTGTGQRDEMTAASAPSPAAVPATLKTAVAGSEPTTGRVGSPPDATAVPSSAGPGVAAATPGPSVLLIAATALAASTPVPALAAFPTLPPTASPGTILFDRSHNEHGATDLQAQFAELAEVLVEDGWELREFDGPALTPEALSDVGVLVVATPWLPPLPFTAAEIDAVAGFIRRGGGLVLSAVGWSWTSYSGLNIQSNPANQIGALFGITVKDDVVLDPTDFLAGFDSSRPVFNVLLPHAVTVGLSAVTGRGISSSLALTGSAAFPLVVGDDDSYARQHGVETSAPVVVAGASFGEGRVIFLGHEGFLIPVGTDAQDGLGWPTFARQLFAWVGGKESPAARPAAETELSYDNGSIEFGWATGPDGGAAVLFTPPAPAWVVTSVRVGGWYEQPSDANREFWIEIWDEAQNELFRGTYRYGDYFQSGGGGNPWATIPIPEIEVSTDFYVAVFPNDAAGEHFLWIGAEKSEPIAERSYTVLYEPNTVELGPHSAEWDTWDWSIRVRGYDAPESKLPKSLTDASGDTAIGYGDILDASLIVRDGVLVASMTLRDDILDQPPDYTAFIWHLDADGDPGTGEAFYELGLEYNLRVAYDPDPSHTANYVWYGYVDLKAAQDVPWEDGPLPITISQNRVVFEIPETYVQRTSGFAWMAGTIVPGPGGGDLVSRDGK